MSEPDLELAAGDSGRDKEKKLATEPICISNSCRKREKTHLYISDLVFRSWRTELPC